MREIRSFIKTASYSDLNKALELIQAAIDEQAKQEEAKKEVLALIKEKGLSLEDFASESATDKRSKVRPKYRIEKDGEVFEWTGRGKTPKAFVGVNLEDHKI
ncbi:MULTISPECIES: H-NS histone family protein [Pseudoalteromonas]|uniref:H-NS histone family protein n=1 Tax=Pseudoalteromonas rubra TaxID=43658 RepID=A0A5S3UV34_9GAMM|nr:MULTISPECIES: H-NS histone family protein [Pseudoalteromonas]MCG7564008.1 H-NS histone family protein [Pseudoalteromonas sp. McH1-42]MEC4087690.1 H-NS histone family protein [Pseudoalteromonas rubra]QPB84159.1 H-NS histone family protein [Pseudoalteromonas rubra]